MNVGGYGDLGSLGRIAIVNRGEPAMRLIHAVRELRSRDRIGSADDRPAHQPPNERRCSSARPTRRSVSIDADRAGEVTSGSPYLDLGALESALLAAAADAAWVGMGIRRRTPGVRRALRAAGHHLRRTSSRRDATARRQDRREVAGRAGRRPGRGVEWRTGDDDRRGSRARATDRLSR